MSALGSLWKKLGLSKSLQLRVMRLLQDQFLIGVTGVIFTESGEILLLKHTYRSTAWSLPGGYLKGGEHPKEGLEREVLEETNLVVSADRRLKIRTDRDTARLDIVCMGTFIGGDFKPSKEVSEYGLFKFDELPTIRRDQLILIDYARNLHHPTKLGLFS